MFSTHKYGSFYKKSGVVLGAIAFLCLFLVFLFSYAGAYENSDVNAYAFDASVNTGTDFSDGDGSDADPYLIRTTNDLLLLSDLVNNARFRASDKKLYSSLSYRLESDLDMTDVPFSPIGLGNDVFRHYFPVVPDGQLEALRQAHWVDEYKVYFFVFDNGEYVSAIDYNGGVHDDTVTYYFLYELVNGFFGHFDGNGHTVSGLSVTAADYCGLFGYAENALIEDLTVTDSVFVSTGKTGAIAGQIVGSQILSCNVTDCSLSNGAGTAVGGGVGSAYAKNKYVIFMDGWNCGEIVYEGLYAEIGEPYDTLLSRLFINDLTFSGENAIGGIVGSGDTYTLTHSFSGVTVPQGTASGTLIGESAYSFVNDCIAVEGALCGTYSEQLQAENLYYPSDLFTDAHFACSLVTNDLITTPVSLYFSLPVSGTYYQSPTSLYKEASVYEVLIDHTHVAYVNTADENDYVLPQAEEKNGYTFAYYLYDETEYEVGEGVSLSSSVDFIPYYTLDAPDEADVIATLYPTYSFLYSAAPHTVATVSYEHPHGFSSVVTWYKQGEPDALVLTASELSLQNVTDSGSYYARVTITWDGNVHLSGSETTSIETDTTAITVLPVTLTATPKALLDESDTAVYTGQNLTPTFSYLLSAEPYEDDLPLLSAVYQTTLSDEVVTKINGVGAYEVSVTLALSSNYAFLYDEPAAFTVTPAVITPAVTPYSGVYDGQPHFPAFDFTTVDGSAYSVQFSSDNRTFSPSYESLAQTDVVANAPVYFSVSAPNHATLQYTSYVTVTACTVTLSVRDGHPSISKTYDGSSAFSGSLTSDYYVASYDGGYEGVGVAFSAASFSSSSAGNTSLNAIFAPINGNFTLSETMLSFPATIAPAAVTVLPKHEVTATYNGSTNFYGLITENDYTVTVENSPAKPILSVYSATANSKHVSEASTLLVLFALSGNNFQWKTTGLVTFSLSLQPKQLFVDTTKIQPIDRVYDGTTDVSFLIDGNPLSGYVSGETPTLTLQGGHIPSPAASETPYSVLIDEYSLSDDNYTINPEVLVGAFSVTISRARPVINVMASVESLYDSATELPALSLVSSDTSGTLSWKSVVKVDGVIDFSRYVTGENEVSFGYTFTPDDSVDYHVINDSIRFMLIPKSPVSFHVTFTGKTNYFAFETFDRTGLTATLAYNDGSAETVTDLISVSYENGNTFLGSDTTVTILYEDGELFTDTIAVTIQKVVLPLPYAPMEYTYNGNPYVLTPADYRSDLMTITDNVGTDAASYDAVVTLTPEAIVNYVFIDGENVAHVTWEIKPLSKYALFLGDSTFVYNGEPITVQLRNDYNADSAFYIVTGEQTATDAGTYHVTVSLKNGNYVWKESASADPLVFTWTIRPKVLEKPEIYDLPFRYDGAQHPVQTDTDDGYVVSGDTVYLHAGSFCIYAELISENNYVWADGTTETVTLTYTVSPLSVIKPTYKESFTFNGGSQSIRVFETDYYTVSGTTFATNANDYTATIRLKSEDFVWSDGSREDLVLSWYILRRSIPVPFASGSVGYTGWEQTALITYDRTYCSASGVTGIDAGSYVATIRLLDKYNTYWSDNTIDDKTFPWEIERAIVNIPRAPENVLYNGLPQTANLPESTQYTVQGNQQKDVGSYEITVSLNDKFNYEWTDGTVSDKKYIWKICALVLSADEAAETVTTYSLGTPLSVPYRSGYTFGGWYLNRDFSGEPVTSLDVIDQNIVLYAKWTEVPSTQPIEAAKQKESVLSTKAIVGISVAGGALVISVLIVLLGILLKRR